MDNIRVKDPKTTYNNNKIAPSICRFMLKREQQLQAQNFNSACLV